MNNDQNPDLLFDLDVAIKACRNSSVENALLLAKRNSKYESCISILIEDICAYSKALDYISEFPFAHAEESLKKHGNILMANCPQRTTDLLKKLCTGYYQSEKQQQNTVNDITRDIVDSDTTNYWSQLNDSILAFDTSTHIDRANPEDFLHLFVKASDDVLVDFLEYLILNMSNCSELIYNTLIEHYLRRWKTDERAEKRLLEILRRPSNLEETRIPYDLNHVLILCSTYDFWTGIMHIYEEQHL